MSEEMPDVYADQFMMTLSPYGVTMSFMTSGAPVAKGQPSVLPHQVLVLRMSLEHAKAMAQIMHTELKHYEEQVIKCPIPLPVEVQKHEGG